MVTSRPVIQQNFAEPKTHSAKRQADLINGWRAKAIIYKKACAADETSRAYLKAKLPDGADALV